MRWATFLLLSWAVGCSLPVAATTVYQCTGPDGRLTYQDTPCKRSAKQQVLRLPDVPTVALPATVATAAVPPRPAAAAPPPQPPEPSAPLTVMYTCMRATDGTTYLSRNGDPAPYLVPFGILGGFPQTLSEVYSPTRGAAGGSAPETNRGRVSPGLVANNYVWVQDQCRELSVEETCQTLEDASEDNAHKLAHAFKSDRAPLQKRDAQLQAQLTRCQ